MSCKPEGRPEVMAMAEGRAGACLSMLRRSHRALHDVEPAFLAAPRPCGPPSRMWMTRRGRERRQERHPSSRPSSLTMTRLRDHLAASTTTHLTLTASACVLARGRQDDPPSQLQGIKRSRPLPAASVVADTYLGQAGAGWPACCEHVEVMLPG